MYGKCHFRILSFLICATVILAGCSEDNSINDTVKGFKEELSNYSFGNYSNLEFQCNVPLIDATKIYTFSAKDPPSGSSNEDKCKIKNCMNKIYDLVVPMEKIVDFQVTDTYGNLTPAVPRYEENGYGGEVYKDNASFMFWHYKEEFGNLDLNFPDDERYDAGNYPKTQYKMLDGSTLSIDDAIVQASNYITKLENENLFDEGEKQILTDIKIGNTDKGSVIILHYRHSKEGLEIDDGGIIFHSKNPNDSKMRNPFFEIIFAGDEYPCNIRNMYSDCLFDKKEVESIMPLSKAEKRLVDSAPPKVKYTINDVNLRYCCIYKQNDEIRTYRPMWCFTVSDRHKSINGNFSQFFPRITYYIDAINGDVYYIDSQTEVFEKLEE